MTRVDREVVIVGSGFAGSILARMLRSRGKEVLLLERDQHPPFTIGESSTPLAALALERIAREYDLPDPDSLGGMGAGVPEAGAGSFPATGISGVRREIESETRLEIAGSKTFSVEVGTQQDLALKQSLDLSVNGRIGRDVSVRAILTDRDPGDNVF